MQGRNFFFVFMIMALSCFWLKRSAEAQVPQQEVDALKEITSTMGMKDWRFDANSCQIIGVTPEPPENADIAESSINCDCHFENNNTICNVVKIVLKGYSLPGMLPPQLVKLPHLQEIDFAYNYLNGTIPLEWASTQLTFISVLVNRLSGKIPKELGNITTLTYLCLEANQFSGIVPPELGDLTNLQTLILSSNNLTGNLPMAFAGLRNLTDFRINDNKFSGIIPDFIQNWKQLTRLEMHASGLKGPIPPNISLLNNLLQLRISDIDGPSQDFPMLRNMTGIVRLVLRNCKISGEIPAYIWTMKQLEMLDVSFNKLVGELPPSIKLEHLRFLFLTGNLLSGNVGDSVLKEGSNIDLSYNNFTWQGLEQPACHENMNLNLNLFRSSLIDDDVSRRQDPHCSKNFNCPRYSNCLHINSGGKDATIKENETNFVYEGDGDVEGGAAKYYINEIQFTNDKTYNSLGKRIFDIYIQEKLVWKDFNIEDDASIAQKPVIKHASNISVVNNVLEIRFYWAGKGTTRIPNSGVYGPLISAVSVVSDSKFCSNGGTKRNVYIIAGVAVGALFLILFIVGILWWKGCLWRKKGRKEDIKGLDLQTGTFTLKQIKAATDDFDSANKIGEGGFGPVYKGQLPDGTVIAVKQLSSKSKQGNREFLNEIGMISCVQHPNLVKLHGCCIDGEQLLLVYEYMENNNLARALFGPEINQLKLDWPTRLKICIGIARGLAFLHEESRIKIVHRDIKATNVLLDGDLNPKISDFGLAKLDEEEKTHISTRVAGTIGYMAPEYALWGHLTYKADVYSFGVVALEVLSGKSNNNYMPSDNCVCLLDQACHLQQTGNLMKLIDESLGSEVNVKEAEILVKVALMCTNASASLRPTMSEVVSMLEGRMTVPDMIPGPSTYSDDLRFKAMRDLHRQRENHSLSRSQTQNSTTIHTFSSPTTSSQDFYEINPEFSTV
ncbi:hypothetical protein ACB098_05G110500 [Castanea mollissima]